MSRHSYLFESRVENSYGADYPQARPASRNPRQLFFEKQEGLRQKLLKVA